MEEFLRFELLHVMYGEPADVMTTLYVGFGKNHLSRLPILMLGRKNDTNLTLKSTTHLSRHFWGNLSPIHLSPP